MRNLLFLISFLTVVFMVSVGFDNHLYHGSNGEGESEENEKGIAGAMSWWYNVRSNDKTGQFDIGAIHEAWNQAEAIGGTRTLGITWEEMGPDNVGGRCRGILFDKIQQGVVFAGGVSGGLWKSTNGGQSWFKVNDQFSSLTVTSITQAANGDIYFGTGEGFYAYGVNNPTGYSAFGFPGKGVWKSTDGGNTFTQLPATIPVNGNLVTEEWAYVNKLSASPTDANIIYAATNKGLRVTTDGGNTWQVATGPPNNLNAPEVTVGGDGWVYACANYKYYRSTAPNATSFELKQGQGGFPDDGFGNMKIAVSSSNPAYVYAVMTTTTSGGDDLFGIYKSTDGGLNWTLIGPGGSDNFNPPGQQGSYNLCIGVLPTNPDVIYCGGQLNLWRYTPDLGWYTVSDWLAEFFDLNIYIHADKHAIVFNPFNGNEMFVGCDGGLFRTGNAQDIYPVFNDLNRNFNVTQCYSASAALTGEVLAGTQDNGTQYIDFLGNTIMSAREVQFGDGGNTEIARTNENAFFAELPVGSVTRSSNKGGAFGFFYDCKIDFSPASDGGCGGDGVIDEGGEWLTPFDLWENLVDSSRSFYAVGAGNVFATSPTGHAWITLGALNFAITPDWFRLPQTSGWVSCVTFSADGNHLYAGTSNGVLYRYSNLQQVADSGLFSYPTGTSTVTDWNADSVGIVTRSVTIGSGRYLRSIAVDPTDPNKVVVTAARYGSTSYVWRSTNALDSAMIFTDITDNLPYMPVWSSLIDADNPNRLIIGTDLGVYARDLSTTDGWSEENTGMARVPTMTIKQVPLNGKNYLYIGTYGRGIFRSGSLSIGIDEVPAVINEVMIFPNPVADVATLRIKLAEASDMEVKVFDLRGREVYQIQQKNTHPGENSININTSKWNSGTYLVSVKAGHSTTNRKMVVIR